MGGESGFYLPPLTQFFLSGGRPLLMTELKDGILSGAARPLMQALASEEAFSETSSAPEGGSL